MFTFIVAISNKLSYLINLLLAILFFEITKTTYNTERLLLLLLCCSSNELFWVSDGGEVEEEGSFVSA